MVVVVVVGLEEGEISGMPMMPIMGRDHGRHPGVMDRWWRAFNNPHDDDDDDDNDDDGVPTVPAEQSSLLLLLLLL